MKKFGRYSFTAGVLFLSSFLASCTLMQKAPNMNTPQNTPNLDGLWADRGGMLSTFCDGQFETHAPDTDEKLAEGSYVFRGPNMLNIEIRSIIRGTISQVSCQVNPDVNLLSCTKANGMRFWLKRHI